MTNETALYFKLLLQTGMTDEYARQTAQLFYTEQSLSGVLLELFECKSEADRGNPDPAISILAQATRDKKIDTDAVLALFTETLRLALDDGRMTQEAVVKAMRLAAEQTGKWEREPWYSMYHMTTYYAHALNGKFDKALFDDALQNFLVDHTLLKDAVESAPANKETFREKIAQEKQEMNRIRFAMDYLVLPAYILAIILLMGGMGVLMSIDPARFEPAAIALVVLFALVTVLLLASVPYVRKKEIALEMARYDLSIAPENRKDAYVFLTDGAEMRFDETGMSVGDDFFRYPNLLAELSTSGRSRRVHLGIMFYTKFEREFEIPLCPDTLALLDRFQIKLENDEDLRCLLQHKRQAFQDVLAYGIVRSTHGKQR